MLPLVLKTALDWHRAKFRAQSRNNLLEFEKGQATERRLLKYAATFWADATALQTHDPRKTFTTWQVRRGAGPWRMLSRTSAIRASATPRSAWRPRWASTPKPRIGWWALLRTWRPVPRRSRTRWRSCSAGGIKGLRNNAQASRRRWSWTRSSLGRTGRQLGMAAQGHYWESQGALEEELRQQENSQAESPT